MHKGVKPPFGRVRAHCQNADWQTAAMQLEYTLSQRAPKSPEDCLAAPDDNL
jgi:hypothetical protein